MAGRPYKHKVATNVGAAYADRFSHQFWTHRIGQLTTSNTKGLKQRTIEGMVQGGSDNKSGGENNQTNIVKSDLQPHALHKFAHDDSHSLLVAFPKSSDHYRNLKDEKLGIPRASVMVGHTEPQLFHWFKQLTTLPPRSIVSGRLQLLTGDMFQEAWEETFMRHPVIHSLAEEMWEADHTKTEKQRVELNAKAQKQDEQMLRRMASGDWRQKFGERERNPTEEEQKEEPIYVVKPETFGVARLVPDVRLWTDHSGKTQRVYETQFAEMDPLARSVPRFIKTLNIHRETLIGAMNYNYQLKCANAFIFDIDKKGLWAMGTQEDVTEKVDGSARETWTEMRLEWGQNQELTKIGEVEWWMRSFSQMSTPEKNPVNESSAQTLDDPELEFRT